MTKRLHKVKLWSNKKPLLFKLEAKFEEKKTCFPHLTTDLEDMKEITAFSLVGETRHSAGQNKEEFLEMFSGDEDAKRLYDIWDKWHLNNIVAGTEAQMEVVKAANIGNKNWYDNACIELARIGLYEDRGYPFGKHWLCRVLPEGLETEVKDLMNRLEQRYKNA